MTRRHCLLPSFRRESFFGAQCYGSETEVRWGALFLLCFHVSLTLWSHWSRQAPPPLPITPENMMSFLIKQWGGSCGSVSHYSSVKCCLWTLGEQWVLTDRVRKKVSESCHSAIQLLEGCCYIPPKPSLLQPGQICLLQPFLTGQVLQPLEPSCWSSAEHVPVGCKFITFWKPDEDLHNMECSPVCS